MAPTLLFVIVFTLLPLGESVGGSLFKHKLNVPRFQVPVFAGLGNFADLFHDSEFLQVVTNTGLYVLVLIPSEQIYSLVLECQPDLIDELCRGYLLADLFVIFASLDIMVGEVDR